MKKELNKTKKSFYNFISMFFNTFILSFISLISTNLIINNYGSDFNGVVATATQVVNLLLIVEGGFTLAINVSLFKPYIENNQKKINGIMSAANKIFRKIALIFLIIGTVATLLLPFVIKSSLSYNYIFLIFLMVIFGTAYNLFFVVTSKIMFQVSQKEYVYTLLGTIFNILSGLTNIILIINNVNMLLIRLSVMIYGMINGLIVYILYKKMYPKINTKCLPDKQSIKGTKDIMIQKVTSVIYVSTPILFISSFIGTKMASVYNVYYSIYNIIKNLLYSLASAPVNGFGQLLSKESKEKVYGKYQKYEYIVVLASMVLLTTTLSLIVAFIKVYTKNVTDINYIDNYIAILICLVIFFELLHIPAGNIINVSGNFKKSRQIQSITAIILVLLLVLGGSTLGIYGILIATLTTNIILSYLEISFVYKEIFKIKMIQFYQKMFVNFIVATLTYSTFINLMPNITNYIQFFICGFVTTILVSIIFLIINLLFFKNETKELFRLLKNFKRK